MVQGAGLSGLTHTRNNICFRILGDLTAEAKSLWRWVSGPKVQAADVAFEDLTVEAKPLWQFWVSGPKVKEQTWLWET